MLEYVLCALLGLVMIGCLLYVSLSPEAEDGSKTSWQQARLGDRRGACDPWKQTRSYRPACLKGAYSSRTLRKITIKQST
jgi:hypothetical protein